MAPEPGRPQSGGLAPSRGAAPPPARRATLTTAVLAAALLACAGAPPVPPPPPPAARPAVPPGENPFLHAEGRALVDGRGNRVVLKGVCFGNGVWADPSLPPARHHGLADFQALRALGANAIRFYLNDGLFEDERRPMEWKASGFEWLDRNLAWARESGLYLVLSLHVPPGGFQSNGGGGALWRDRRNQERLVALWRAIAHRYRDEPALAGYDLLNEPTVVGGGPERWEALAREALAAIRDEDQRHAVFVERLNAAGRGGRLDWRPDRNGEMNFFLLEDANVVYEFHFYEPMAFTHQGASWIPALQGVRSTYPGRVADPWGGGELVADRAFLAARLAPYLAFGRRHGVPVFLGEFGVIREGFAPGRNGAGWVADVADLALAEGVGLTYHAFHEPPFGLYADPDDRPPAQLNRPLAEALERAFRR